MNQLVPITATGHPIPVKDKDMRSARIKERWVIYQDQPAPIRSYVIECAKCSASFFTPHRPQKWSGDGIEVKVVRIASTAVGWAFDARGRHTCPNCTPERKAMPSQKNQVLNLDPPRSILAEQVQDAANSPTVQPLKSLSELGGAIRTPTPEHRRAIFRAIDEAYDDKAKCYVDGFTDQIIADRLKCPRAWVTERREADFGPAGDDPALTKLRADLKKAQADIDSRIAKHLDAASSLEVMGKTLAELVTRTDAALGRV